jgi:hypothetical protein
MQVTYEEGVAGGDPDGLAVALDGSLTLSNDPPNATGFTNFEFTIGGKWAQLMRELAPDIRRMALIFKPETAPFADKYFRPAQVAAASLGIELSAAPVHEVAAGLPNEVGSNIQSICYLYAA